MYRRTQVCLASTKDLVDGLFTSNKYDGAKAADTWRMMNSQEENFKNSKIARNVYLLAFLFSGYNYFFRFNSLSSSGKNWARFGFVFSYFVAANIQSRIKRNVSNAKKYD